MSTEPATEIDDDDERTTWSLWAIVAAAVLVLLFGVIAVGTLRGCFYTDPQEAAKTEEEEKKEEEKKAGSGIVSFEPFIVNLADTQAQRFLRISVRLIVGEEEEAKHIQESEVQVMRLRSAILEVLTAQTSDRIVTAEGKTALKKEIAERAAHILEHVEVSDVLFSDFVVQY